jgi:hypothetical protein
VRILDFDFPIPDEFSVTIASKNPSGMCVDIIGDHADALVEPIVKTAEYIGFVTIEYESGRIELSRSEQRVLLLFERDALTLQTYDPTGFPMARTDGSAVLLGDFRVDLGPARIDPLREKYTGDPQWLRAEWRIRDLSAPEIVGRVINQAVATKGLKRGAVFGPARGGMEVWSGEAYSDLELVKAHATTELSYVLLEVELVNKRER